MCEDVVKKTDAKLIYVHHDIKSTGVVMKHYYDFVISFNGTGNTATRIFYRDRYVVDICDMCLYLQCNNAEELNLLGYAERNNKKIFVME